MYVWLSFDVWPTQHVVTSRLYRCCCGSLFSAAFGRILPVRGDALCAFERHVVGLIIIILVSRARDLVGDLNNGISLFPIERMQTQPRIKGPRSRSGWPTRHWRITRDTRVRLLRCQTELMSIRFVFFPFIVFTTYSWVWCIVVVVVWICIYYIRMITKWNISHSYLYMDERPYARRSSMNIDDNLVRGSISLGISSGYQLCACACVWVCVRTCMCLYTFPMFARSLFSIYIQIPTQRY